VALGGMLPQQYFSHHLSNPQLIAAAADLVLLAGLAVAVLMRGTPRLLGAGLAGLVAVLLLAFNGGWIYPWEGLSLLGLMFTGTALYRAEQGQYSWLRAGAVAVTTIGLAIAAGLWHSHSGYMAGAGEPLWERRWFFALFLAGLTFGGGLLLRRMPVPKWLAWLGLTSYSIYLLHPLLIEVYYYSPLSHSRHSRATDAVLVALFMIVLITLSSLTYVLVERPMQTAGRRVGKWLDARYGPDCVTPPQVRHAVLRDSAPVGEHV
jgi:peptidoglycan/LPS O-acetylase OafA/YrhL